MHWQQLGLPNFAVSSLIFSIFFWNALGFFHNAFLCLVYLIPRYTAAKNLPHLCDLQKGQRPLVPPKAASTSLVRTQQPSSHVAQRFLHTFPYTSPGSRTKPGQALSPYGFVVGSCTVLACQKGLGVGLPRKQHSGNHSETHLSATTSSGRSPTCPQAVHREAKERKLLN